MSETSKPEKTGRGPKSSDSEKARLERQSAALRENLRRRNAQRRGRATGARDSEPSEGES
jgi:hypothetical protein